MRRDIRKFPYLDYGVAGNVIYPFLMAHDFMELIKACDDGLLVEKNVRRKKRKAI